MIANHSELAAMYSRKAADEIASRNDGSDTRAEQYLRLVELHTQLAVAQLSRETR